MSWLIRRPAETGMYYYGHRIDGKDRYISLETKDTETAETAQIRWDLHFRTSAGPVTEPSPNMSVDALAELYLKQADIIPKTVTTNKNSWGHWKRVVGNKTIGSTTREDALKFRDTLIEEDFSEASIGIFFRDTHKLFAFATTKGLILKNPLVEVELPQDEDETFRVLTKEEEARLLEHANPLMARVIPFALETGLRLSQIVNLDWKQFKSKDHLIFVAKQKRQKARHIPVFKRALEAMGTPKLSGQVFPILGDSQIKQMWKRLKKKAGIQGRLRFHDLRHTCASRMAEVLTPVELRDFFGWSSVAVCDKYIHSSAKNIKEKMERLLQGSL